MPFLQKGGSILAQLLNILAPLTSIWISTATIIRKVLEENASGIPLLSKLVKYIARQRGLLDLPLEIKLEILKKLEWKDILLVRQTCRQLAEVTRERPIWLCLFSKHLLSTPPYRLRLERPIVKYSSVELENIVLRWHGAEIGWTSDGRIPLRERELQIDDDIHRALYLVPGGRWLLVATRKGTVDYYDLDTPNPSPRVLVPPQFGSSADAMLHMSVDVDMVDESGTDCLPLSFNVGLLHQRRDIHPDTQQIQIWRVTFKVKNEDNQSDSLHARCLSDFPDEYVGQPKLFLLSGPHVAYTARSTSDFGGSFVVILNWTSLDGGDLNYRRRYISLRDRIDKIAFLPSNRFFITSGKMILSVYNLHFSPETHVLPSQQRLPNQDPLWTHTVTGLKEQSVSGPIFMNSSTRFLLATDSGIHGIVIPDGIFDEEAGIEPQMSKLLDCTTNWHPYAFGYRLSVSIFYTKANLYSIRWPDESGASVLLQKKLPSVPRSVVLLCLDECSGRIVFICHCSVRYQRLLDFSIQAE